MGHYTNCLLFLSVLLMTSCASQTRVEEPVVADQNKQQLEAERLFSGGHYAAARLFQSLAEIPSVHQGVYQLQAADALLQLGDDDTAKDYLDMIDISELAREQRSHLFLLYAQFFLKAGDAEQALNRLMLVSLLDLSVKDKATYHKLSALAYALTGRLVDSAHERIALTPYLQSEQEREDNNIAILEVLALLSTPVLDAQRALQRYDIYSGWIELAVINRTIAQGTTKFAQALADWQLQYPEHPANLLVTSGYFSVQGLVLGDVSHIAIFLPESGAYSAHAKAVKAGFMAAYYQHEHDVFRPEITFYDTQSTSIVMLYHQAIAEGAQLVVGPLNKVLIQELVESSELSVPVVALNYVDGLVKKNLYQFALSPIDEVQQVVNQAWYEGHKKAVVLTREGADGERLAHYFQDAWEAAGGMVLAVQTYKPRRNDFSFPVRQLLNINESQYRYRALRKVIGSIEYIPRRRHDIDVIFMTAKHNVARLINPQFYHNHASKVAVYGLSRVYAGHLDKSKDIDLENVRFCSIPWLFNQAYQGDLTMYTLQETWQQFPDRFLSLIAFGIDAYEIVPHLNQMAGTPFSGATGRLSLNKANRIVRQLVCAKFQKGEVNLIDSFQEEPSGYENIATEVTPVVDYEFQ